MDVPTTFADYVKSLDGRGVELETSSGHKAAGRLTVVGDYVKVGNTDVAYAIAFIARIGPVAPRSARFDSNLPPR
jgi:hypothetical protein